jgi:kumamolisin
LRTPIVIPVSVDGGANAPGGEDDIEVALDIEVIGACAPGARIVVYFSTNDRTSDGFLDALTKAVHDDQYSPSVISVSWGASEDQRTRGFQKKNSIESCRKQQCSASLFAWQPVTTEQQ